MIVMEHDDTISLANSHFEQITGYSRGEIENKRTFADFIDEASKREAAGYPARRLANDPTVPTEYEATIVTRSGEAREISVSVGIFHGTGQRIASIVDFTERNRTWKELERHRDHLAAVLSIYQMGEAGTGELTRIPSPAAWRPPRAIREEYSSSMRAPEARMRPAMLQAGTGRPG